MLTILAILVLSQNYAGTQGMIDLLSLAACILSTLNEIQPFPANRPGSPNGQNLDG
jgi:hypothetical protein